MFANPAPAQAASGAPAGGDLMTSLIQFSPFILIFILFYFLMIRPQQRRMKEHQATVGAVKRGDTVVLSNGMVGKVTRVEETDAMVEIASGVNTRVVKSMIAEVRTRGEPAPANDSKS
jgi:preprotein translocase subunit YajC